MKELRFLANVNPELNLGEYDMSILFSEMGFQLHCCLIITRTNTNKGRKIAPDYTLSTGKHINTGSSEA
jgi:hypothetical protein